MTQAINDDEQHAKDYIQGLADGYTQDLKDEFAEISALLVADRENTMGFLNTLAEDSRDEIKALQKQKREC